MDYYHNVFLYYCFADTLPVKAQQSDFLQVTLSMAELLLSVFPAENASMGKVLLRGQSSWRVRKDAIPVCLSSCPVSQE